MCYVTNFGEYKFNSKTLKKIFFWQILTLEDPKFAQNPAPRAVATALGSLAPLKEPLRMQNTHFRFNIQL